MAAVLLFDLNGTLLDVSALDGHFRKAFGAAEARELWFQQLQGLFLTTAATGQYTDFSTLAGAALAMLTAKEGVDLDSGMRASILAEMKSLPPFEEVPAALERLGAAGRRLAVLTNGTLASAREQLKNAGLARPFEQVLSADEVRRYKPAPEPYRMAAERLGVAPGEILMVAAHAWDLAGAHAAGLKTAFLKRPKQPLNPADPRPDYEAADLSDLASKIS